MNSNCEVISAFIDDEPFEADALANALATVEGRQFLIDAIALRGLVRFDSNTTIVTRSKPSLGRLLALAAAVILATIASFQLGQRQGLNDSMRAPEPTRVISAPPAWQTESSRGGIR